MKQNDGRKLRRIFCMAFSVLLCLMLCAAAFADGADDAISTEEFMADYQETFHKRELAASKYDDEVEEVTEEVIQTYAECAEAERDFYEKYSNARLQDENLQFICDIYLYGLKAQYEAIDAIRETPENDTIWVLWNVGTGVRYRAIIELAEKYGLPVEESMLEEMKETLEWPFLFDEEE